MKKIFTALTLLLAFTACRHLTTQTANYNVVPLPQEITIDDQAKPFELNASTVIVVENDNDSLQNYATLLQGYLRDITSHELKIAETAPETNFISLSATLDCTIPESYRITVTDSAITVNGATPAGTFYGIQTLRKSIPAIEPSNVTFPAASICDWPRFPYRGAMLDVSRHFFGVDSVKSFIDMMALHNLNRLHWHLTDDQGWRVEIKSRPRLAEISSKRTGTVIGHNTDEYDSIPVEGYYTQEQIRDIVKYASDRNIVIVPEIDLPGHMVAALTAYPELGCTGGPYDVWQKWGVSEDLLCAGNDSTLRFLDDVLTEMVDMFPGELFHIGGDECPKTRWEECPKCQLRIKELGLKTDAHSTAEQKLQSYVMEHAKNLLAQHGRRIIGWDEILEGGMDQNAVVMSWRGEAGGIEGAKKGHDVIMSPNSFLYFDYYQTLDHTGEPDAIGGYIPVEKVYGYEPMPESLNEEEQKHIFGVQANLWTEYIPTMSQAQYMELPRMAALAEVQWTMPEKKDYKNFTSRIPQLTAHYDALGYRYARHIFNVNGKLELDSVRNVIVADLSTVDNAPVHYTLDGAEPSENSPLYTEPVVLDKTCTIKAAAFRPSGMSMVFTDSVNFNKATACRITLEKQPSLRYKGRGAGTLNDGRSGTPSFNTDTWLGFEGNDMVATIDFGKPTEISHVSAGVLVDTDNWIMDATEMSVEAAGENGKFSPVASMDIPQVEKRTSLKQTHTIDFAPVTTTAIRVTLKCQNVLPQWHHAAGRMGYLFTDEIAAW